MQEYMSKTDRIQGYIREVLADEKKHSTKEAYFMSVQFEYFYGNQAEQFAFYRIPKLLITSPEFKRVSDSAKLLYGLMLDRMSLSIKNGWVDDENRAFIYFTTNDVMEQMCCGTEKATKLLAELDVESAAIV